MLSHYLILERLLSELSMAAKSAFKSVTQYVMQDGSSPSQGYPMLKVGIIDSHFHLDMFSNHQKNVREITTLSDL